MTDSDSNFTKITRTNNIERELRGWGKKERKKKTNRKEKKKLTENKT